MKLSRTKVGVTIQVTTTQAPVIPLSPAVMQQVASFDRLVTLVSASKYSEISEHVKRKL